MNLLYEKLPAVYEYGGKQYDIRTDFRDWIRFELLFTDRDVPMRDKKNALLRIIFPVAPPDPDLWEFILWFYQCGKESRGVKSDSKSVKAKKQAAVYSFEYDDGYVYAAFLEVYGLDLTAVEYLHWWKFKSLFRGLHDCKFTDIMSYRAEEITKKTPDYRKTFLQDMKKLYALPRSLSEQQKIDELKRIKEKYQT